MLYRCELLYMREIESEHVDKWLQAVDRNLELWTKNLSRARVIDIGGQPAGIMLWMPLPEGVAVLVTIHVLPQFRRQGLGQCLLERFVSDASASGSSTLTLGVHKVNPARELYEQAGFRADPRGQRVSLLFDGRISLERKRFEVAARNT